MDVILAVHSMVLLDEMVAEGKGKMVRLDAIAPMLPEDQRASLTLTIKATHHFAPQLVDVL